MSSLTRAQRTRRDHIARWILALILIGFAVFPVLRVGMTISILGKLLGLVDV